MDKIVDQTPESERLKDDDLHITPRLGKLIGTEINKSVKSFTRATVDTPDELENIKEGTVTSVQMKVEKDFMKHVIGAKGATVKKIENEKTVKISARIDSEGPYKWIVINGMSENVKGAVKRVHEIVKYVKSITPCRYFQNGRCKRGQKCVYKHIAKESRNRSRSPLRSRDPSKERVQYYEHEMTRRNDRESHHRERSRSPMRRGRWHENNEHETRRNPDRGIPSRTGWHNQQARVDEPKQHHIESKNYDRNRQRFERENAHDRKKFRTERSHDEWRYNDRRH